MSFSGKMISVLALGLVVVLPATAGPRSMCRGLDLKEHAAKGSEAPDALHQLLFRGQVSTGSLGAPMTSIRPSHHPPTLPHRPAGNSHLQERKTP